jgi:23S rRNA G2445 N2-methylase RlmL
MIAVAKHGCTLYRPRISNATDRHPMCGSGTIAIEAAMMAIHKAPQIHFEWLKNFDRNLCRVTQDRVWAEKLEAPTAPVVASDINAAYVAMAKKRVRWMRESKST